MAISQKDVLRVAHLARVGLSEKELELFSAQLEAIIGFIDKLREADTSDTKPMSHVLEMGNVLRKDTAGEPFKKEAVLENAPQKAKGYFQVPKVIE